MSKPVKLHPRIAKEARKIRLPDASEKDNKIAACATLGNFYKEKNDLIDPRRVQSNYKTNASEIKTSDESSRTSKPFNNPPIPF